MVKCEKCNQEISDDKKAGIVIVSKHNSETILYQSDKLTIKEAVEEAVSKGANLEYANLKGANLEYANLEGAKTTCCTINFSSTEYTQAKQFVEGLK